ARRLALGLRPGKENGGAIAVAQLARRSAIDVPTGIGRKRHRDVGQPDARRLVAVGIDRGHAGAIGGVGMLRRLARAARRGDPSDGWRGGLTRSAGGRMRLALGTRVRPFTAGIRRSAAATALPAATDGTRFAGEATPFVNQSSIATTSARRAGPGLTGLVGLAQTPAAERSPAPPPGWVPGIR